MTLRIADCVRIMEFLLTCECEPKPQKEKKKKPASITTGPYLHNRNRPPKAVHASVKCWKGPSPARHNSK